MKIIYWFLIDEICFKTLKLGKYDLTAFEENTAK